uniref:Antigenic membrane protein AMP n=1 Tax=Candidatus Phytoplasma solani TaxID=69896 RepID=A0A284VUZ0_9MOLU|nr:Antigenic membrane protein AMP [Candidatus Phytoplasma solani]SNR20513.1 Antigenic membrane protein AMP [Candidatus Phytoplasma solani]SNR20514.1 Antigenic membrane protein AMP [Candidatus Phytoplasma solani]SNR20515.1 Antigenic membrane protein AMP [Candidatus Phytoplasma solani]SNR20516.1 Antigenic membrane protein AMP [Candidatus Phytoplasma solani]
MQNTKKSLVTKLTTLFVVAFVSLFAATSAFAAFGGKELPSGTETKEVAISIDDVTNQSELVKALKKIEALKDVKENDFEASLSTDKTEIILKSKDGGQFKPGDIKVKRRDLNDTEKAEKKAQKGSFWTSTLFIVLYVAGVLVVAGVAFFVIKKRRQ